MRYTELWNFVPTYFRSREQIESSIAGTFAPWNFRSLELSSAGTFSPENENDVELSLPTTNYQWFIQTKKAFDKVPHNRLISKLGLYGIDQALVNSPYAHQNLFSRLHMGSNDQIQALFSPTILELRKKLKARASSTKSQQLRALKSLFYTASQITFLFSLLTSCIYRRSSLVDSRHF